jgi:undecaprenyl diphosphate synthase
MDTLRHLAIIPDGNRRWAASRGVPALEGHRRGYEKIKDVARLCFDRGIPMLTVFAFSTENWKRAEQEVSYLMNLLRKALEKDTDEYVERGVRLKILGERRGLPEGMAETIEAADAKSASGERGQINICLNYGGRAEIVEGMRRLIAEGARPEDLTEEKVAAALWTGGLPDPDLIIRTSGERRLSGFLTWSSAYAELLFTEKHWPDFDAEALEAALADFEGRKRRFGG